MPKAIASPRVVFGRSMIGSSGISLVSTVMSVIEVPATHSCGKPSRSPATTDAISSSVAW